MLSAAKAAERWRGLSLWNLVLEPYQPDHEHIFDGRQSVHQSERPYRHPKTELTVGYGQGSLGCWA